MIKKIFFVFILLFSSITLISAQHTVSFNKYGLYIVENGRPTEIKTEQDSLPYFFEDYLILNGIMSIGYCIYNIRTKAITKWIYVNIFKVELNKILIVYFSKKHLESVPSPPFGYQNRSVFTYWKWELDLDTLKIKSETQLPKDPFPEVSNFFFTENLNYPEGNDYIHYTIKKQLGDRLYRYSGKNFYLDINYGPNVDLTGQYHYEVQGGKKDIFVVGIHKWDGR